MQYFIFFYNIALTILFGVCAFGFLLLYQQGRRTRELWAAVLFFLYICDNLLFAMNEFIPEFVPVYQQIVNLAPYMYNLMDIGMIYCFRIILGDLLGRMPGRGERAAHVVLLAALLILTALATFPACRVAYRALEQGTVLVLMIWSFWAWRMGRNTLKDQKKLFWALVIGTGLHVGGAVESFVVLAGGPKGTYRIICYEVFGVFCAAAAVWYLLRKVTSPPERGLSEAEILERFIRHYGLTPREAELLPYLMAGKDNAAISREHFIALNTVKVHAHNIYQKLGVERRGQVAGCYECFKKQFDR